MTMPRSKKAQRIVTHLKEKLQGTQSGIQSNEGDMKQGYNDRLDESLGKRHGKKKQSLKARRDESKDAEKGFGKRAYAAIKSLKKK